MLKSRQAIDPTLINETAKAVLVVLIEEYDITIEYPSSEPFSDLLRKHLESAWPMEWVGQAGDALTLIRRTRRCRQYVEALKQSMANAHATAASREHSVKMELR